jgi:hypothetical protein
VRYSRCFLNDPGPRRQPELVCCRAARIVAKIGFRPAMEFDTGRIIARRARPHEGAGLLQVAMDLESQHRDFDQQQENDSHLQPLAAQVPAIVGDAVVGAFVQILESFETVRRRLEPRIYFRLVYQPHHHLARVTTLVPEIARPNRPILTLRLDSSGLARLMAYNSRRGERSKIIAPGTHPRKRGNRAIDAVRFAYLRSRRYWCR